MRSGVSAETNLPTEWGPETNVAWKVEMPAWTGATPIIWGERVFLNVADGTNISLWCLDRDTGETLWARLLSDGDRRARKQNMSSPSPVTNGEHVYVMTGTGKLTAFRLRRERDLETRHSGVIRSIWVELGVCVIALVGG